ncbi:MAG: HAD family hydrolase [Gemmatimonadota bacterium]
MNGAAVFLDRDGTIIRDTHYVANPADVQLLPEAASAVRRLNESGLPVIVITNQSGIARGIFGEQDYEAVRGRIDDLLLGYGAHIDATYMCPHHPDITGDCECRKPGTLLYRQAAEDFGLDFARSWYVGDKLRDLFPSRELGGRGILVPTEETPRESFAEARRDFEVARSLDAAVRRIVESVG